MKTQKEKIKNHLQQIGSITSFAAFTQYSITRLSSIILKLRIEGCKITTVLKPTRNGLSHYADYILEK